MLLAIDSATRVLSIALHDGEQVVAELTWTTPNRHTVELTPAIQELLTRSKVTVEALTAIAVSQGPGSFSGLRIGFSVAKGLAMARSLPLIAIPTLDILAAAQPPSPGNLIAVLEAGRGRICAGTYRWNGSAWVSLDDLRIASWETVLEDIRGEHGTTVISGEIDSAGRALIEQRKGLVSLVPPAFALRRAAFLAELAYTRLQQNQTSDLESVVPIYLHQPGVPHP